MDELKAIPNSPKLVANITKDKIDHELLGVGMLGQKYPGYLGLSQKFNQTKLQRADQLQNVITICQTMMNDNKEEFKDEFEHLVTRLAQNEEKCKNLENQMEILMEIMKLPEEKQTFLELKNAIEKIQSNHITEKEHADNFDQDNIESQNMNQVSYMENFLNNPGLQHLAKEIFWNLNAKNLEICSQINQSSCKIIENPMFWLKKCNSSTSLVKLTKKSQMEWTKDILALKNKRDKLTVTSYLMTIHNKGDYTHNQKLDLEKEFQFNRYQGDPDWYLTPKRRIQIAQALCLTDCQVKIWFQNRSLKWKKENKSEWAKAIQDLKNKRHSAHGLCLTECQNKIWCKNRCNIQEDKGWIR